MSESFHRDLDALRGVTTVEAALPEGRAPLERALEETPRLPPDEVARLAKDLHREIAAAVWDLLHDPRSEDLWSAWAQQEHVCRLHPPPPEGGQRLRRMVLVRPVAPDQPGRELEALGVSSKHAAQFLRFAWAEEPWTWRNGRAERRHDIELARKALVMGNLRLAASYRDGRISLLEKLTAGAVGLVNGVDGLDQDQASLGTYGALWVRAKVLRLSHTYGDGARRSSLQLEYRFKLRRWLRDQRAEGCAPDFAALCRAFPELGQDMVWMSLVEVSDRSPRLSRTSPLPEDDDALVRARTATWKEITADWEKLQERERRVLHDRVGLSGSVQTLTEIGKHFNLSRERIRQLEMSGWLRLRPPESPAAVEFWRHLASNPEKRTSMLASLHVKLPAPPSLLVTMVSKLGVSTLAEARAVPKDALRALPCAGKGKRQAWVRWLNQVERDALVAAFAQVGGAVDCIRPKLVKSP